MAELHTEFRARWSETAVSARLADAYNVGAKFSSTYPQPDRFCPCDEHRTARQKAREGANGS